MQSHPKIESCIPNNVLQDHQLNFEQWVLHPNTENLALLLYLIPGNTVLALLGFPQKFLGFTPPSTQSSASVGD